MKRILVIDILLVAMGLAAWAGVHAWRNRWRVPGPHSRIVIPVFCLHRTAPVKRSEFNVPPDKFERLLKAIKLRKFQCVSMAELSRALHEKGPLPPRPAAMVLDDAYHDNYTHAFPLLKQYKWKAGFAVPTGRVSTSATHRAQGDYGPNPVTMTWDELKVMSDAGMDILSHSVSHPNLQKCDPQAVVRELRDSRRILEEAIGRPILGFVYPGGRHSREVRAAVREAGYKVAFLSGGGVVEFTPQTDPYRLLRVHVSGHINVEALVESIPNCRW